jgi:hypothetical protein
MFDELVKLADDLDELGRHKTVDHIDYIIAVAQEVHVDSKGIKWTNEGPVNMPRGHFKWVPERGVVQILAQGLLPETPEASAPPKVEPKPQAQAPKSTTGPAIDIDNLGKGFKWLKEKGWI